MIKIKNWNEFQHFKDRNPPWVKLHKQLLDDPEWFELSDRASKLLVMLWLIASEDKNKQGYLPDIKKISFRTRISQDDIKSLLSELNQWLEYDDISVISDRCQVDVPEAEAEAEAEREAEREGETESKNVLQEELTHYDFILKNDLFYVLPVSLYNQFAKTFPTVNLETELIKAQTWLIANKPNRKTATGMPRYLNSWLTTAKPVASDGIGMFPVEEFAS